MSEHRVALWLFGTVLAVWLAGMAVALRDAALPDAAEGKVLAVFPLDMADGAAFDAVIRAGGRPVRKTWAGFAWVAQGEGEGFVGRLRDEGAVTAFGEIPVVGPALGGCMAVSVDRQRSAENRIRP